MKALLISDHAKWCALMMNGDKTVEVRKGTALYKATQKLIDEYGFAEFYVYCTKDEELFYDPKTKKWLTMKNRRNCPRLSNGMVVFKFRCYKVEEITQVIRVRDNKIMLYRGLPKGINNKPLMNESCLSFEEMKNYLGYENGTAIHISQLEIFKSPKELSEFYKVGAKEEYEHIMSIDERQAQPYIDEFYRLTKAPQSFCYIEV